MSELHTPSSFVEIIDRIGFDTLAELLDTEESHIRTMKARDSIPPEYWGVVAEHAEAHGLAVDWSHLKALRHQRFSRDRAARAAS